MHGDQRSRPEKSCSDATSNEGLLDVASRAESGAVAPGPLLGEMSKAVGGAAMMGRIQRRAQLRTAATALSESGAIAEKNAGSSRFTVGAASDGAEQEADSVARQTVERIHQPAEVQAMPVRVSGRGIQGAQAIGNVARKETGAEAGAQAIGAGGGAVGAETEAALENARGGGRPLPDELRAKLEKSFGADFSAVRVHDDAAADGLAKKMSARAFTSGHDLFFRKGEYDPASKAGQELIAHELTHVVQQQGGGAAASGGGGALQRVITASAWCEENKHGTNPDTLAKQQALRTLLLANYATPILEPEYRRAMGSTNKQDMKILEGQRQYMKAEVQATTAANVTLKKLETLIAAIDAFAEAVTTTIEHMDEAAAEKEKHYAEKNKKEAGKGKEPEAAKKDVSWTVHGGGMAANTQVNAVVQDAFTAFVTDVEKGTAPQEAGAGTASARGFEALGRKAASTHSIRLSQGARLYFNIDSVNKTVTIVRWGDHSLS